MLKLAKFSSISLFVISLIVLVVYGNYLMVYRPNYKIIRDGFIYPFLGKGKDIYISMFDYSILFAFGFSLLISVIVTNRLYRKKDKLSRNRGFSVN